MKLLTALARLAAGESWRCAKDQHRIGNLHSLHTGDDGYIYYDCAECTRPVRLQAAWAATPTMRLPSTDASAFLTCDRLDAREVDEHERAKVRLRETLGLKAEGFRRMPK